MSTEPRTVAVNILVTKSLTIDEPSWCVDPHRGAQFMPDITHNGPEVSAAFHTPHGTARYLTAWITQAPHGELHPELQPVLAIEVDGDAVSFDPEAVRAFTAITRAHLDALDEMAAEVERLRGEGQ